MKNLKLISVLFIFLGLFSCDNNSKDNERILGESMKTLKKVNKAEDFRERLKALEPVTEQALKNWFPKNLNGYTLTDFFNFRGSQKEIAQVAGIYYQDNDTNTKLQIHIADGASNSGLLAIQSHYMAQNLEMDNSRDSGYEKTYEKNGFKVLETYVKKDDFYRVLFLYDMRFGVTVESNGLSYDELWQTIEVLDLEKLKKL